MASTGVSGRPADERLEARGLKVSPVTARPLQQGPGRQRDGKDGPWSQDWPTCGLLSGSLRPEAERGAGRASRRHRAPWLGSRAAPMQHRQQARPQMQVPLTPVRTDVTGAPGLASSRAIVAGERGPVPLARVRAPRGASSTAASVQA
jgi:transposase